MTQPPAAAGAGAFAPPERSREKRPSGSSSAGGGGGGVAQAASFAGNAVGDNAFISPADVFARPRPEAGSVAGTYGETEPFAVRPISPTAGGFPARVVSAEVAAAVAGDPNVTAAFGRVLSHSPNASPRSRVSSGSDVWLHIYHCDAITGALNKAFLRSADVGIYHAGVEVYNVEWSFQYFEDTWEDPSVSGVMCCRPRSMCGYEYQESVFLGRTSFSEYYVRDLIDQLKVTWPACTYHLTHRNCLSFAEHLSKALMVPQPFPAWLKGILDASTNTKSVDFMVDYSWSWLKWWMIQRSRREQQCDTTAAAAPRGIWMCNPGMSCTPMLCPSSAERPAPDNLAENLNLGRREASTSPESTASLPRSRMQLRGAAVAFEQI
eukprot:TRINITY_DN14886_c0_g1_i1.p1 TRINITY_DN14886_c0_g1~~TRINITY_DN14886_c0_g1_i1.p1  ORF type:complete len:379 (+),score=65.37 TRINITY_DN14886_c0_g1_i1:110-1246(+)